MLHKPAAKVEVDGESTVSKTRKHETQVATLRRVETHIYRRCMGLTVGRRRTFIRRGLAINAPLLPRHLIKVIRRDCLDGDRQGFGLTAWLSAARVFLLEEMAVCGGSPRRVTHTTYSNSRYTGRGYTAS